MKVGTAGQGSLRSNGVRISEQLSRDSGYSQMV